MTACLGQPVQVGGTVVHNVPIARDTFRLRVRQPDIARTILPGQFVMIRIPGRTDPLLARPYALYDTADGSGGDPEYLDIVYLVIGGGTRCLATRKPDDPLVFWGPLGNTFPCELPAALGEHLLLVAGGIGQTPFLALIKELWGQRRYGDGRAVAVPKRITMAYGVRHREYLAGLDDFRQTGVDLAIATDDGSLGHPGYVTELAEAILARPKPPTALFGCGPEPMMARLAQIAREGAIPCWLSLETKMGCGYGVCFSCVCAVRQDSSWDYRRVCLEGPVFDASQLVWNPS